MEHGPSLGDEVAIVGAPVLLVDLDRQRVGQDHRLDAESLGAPSGVESPGRSLARVGLPSAYARGGQPYRRGLLRPTGRATRPVETLGNLASPKASRRSRSGLRLGRQIAGDRVVQGRSTVSAKSAGWRVASIGMHAERLEQAGEPASRERVAASPFASTVDPQRRRAGPGARSVATTAPSRSMSRHTSLGSRLRPLVATQEAPIGTVTDTVYPRRCYLVTTPGFRAPIAHVRHRLTGIRFSSRHMGGSS